MTCDSCDAWYHMDCEKVPDAVYKFYKDQRMAKLNFYWICKSCSKKNMESKKVEKYMEDTTKTLTMLQGEILNMKQMMKENGENIAESGKVLKEELKKAKPSFAEILGEGKEEKKMMKKFAASVANTQKRITDDREERKNNVIIFNVKEETKEDKEALMGKFNELCSEIDPDKAYTASLERIGKQESGNEKKSKNPRPIKVVFPNSWDKRLFLAKLRNLKGNEKFNNVRVSHDMGIEDREENRRLLKEAYDLNQANAKSDFKYKVRGPPWAMEIKMVKKN